jgi:transcriptional regulator with XRE-family HTH domain
MDAAKYVADAIRAEMARKRRTQAELAAALNLTPGTISRRLSGDKEFTVTEIVGAALWLGVPVATFIPPEASALSA